MKRFIFAALLVVIGLPAQITNERQRFDLDNGVHVERIETKGEVCFVASRNPSWREGPAISCLEKTQPTGTFRYVNGLYVATPVNANR